MNVVEFKTWITNKYVDWRGNAIGHEKTLTEYAEWLGISQPLLSMWMSGEKKPRSNNSLKRLIDKYGTEAYEILGLPVPMQDKDFLNLSLTTQEEAITLMHRLADEFGLRFVLLSDDDQDQDQTEQNDKRK